MPDTLSPNTPPPRDWNAAFAALPLETPSGDGWARLQSALATPGTRMPPSARRTHRRSHYALAATLAVAALVPLALLREPDSSTTPTPTMRVARQPVPSAVPPASMAPEATTPLATTTIAREPASTLAIRDATPTPTRARRATPRKPTGAPQHHDTAVAANVAPPTPAPTDRNEADALTPLQAESARLEALIALNRDDRAGSAAAAVMAVELDQRVGRIDAELAQPALSPTQREALWQQRVQALRELAGVETTQRWLATQGERLDGALVSVD